MSTDSALPSVVAQEERRLEQVCAGGGSDLYAQSTSVFIGSPLESSGGLARSTANAPAASATISERYSGSSGNNIAHDELSEKSSAAEENKNDVDEETITSGAVAVHVDPTGATYANLSDVEVTSEQATMESSYATLNTSVASVFSRTRFLATAAAVGDVRAGHENQFRGEGEASTGGDRSACASDTPRVSYGGWGSVASPSKHEEAFAFDARAFPPTPTITYAAAVVASDAAAQRRGAGGSRPLTVADVVLRAANEYNQQLLQSRADNKAKHRPGMERGRQRLASRVRQYRSYLTLLPRRHGVNEALLLAPDTFLAARHDPQDHAAGLAATTQRVGGLPSSAMRAAGANASLSASSDVASPGNAAASPVSMANESFSTVVSERIKDNILATTHSATRSFSPFLDDTWDRTSRSDKTLTGPAEGVDDRGANRAATNRPLLLETACQAFREVILQPVKVSLHASSAGGTYMVTADDGDDDNSGDEDVGTGGKGCGHRTQKNATPGTTKPSSKTSATRPQRQRVLAVFKPRDEEIGQDGNPHGNFGSDRAEAFVPGTGSRREVLAYVLDHGGFAGVPPTLEVATHWHDPQETRAQRRSDAPRMNPFLQPATATTNAAAEAAAAPDRRLGALRHRKALDRRANVPPSTVSRIGSLQLFVPDCVESADLLPGKFDVDEVHALAIFDIRTLNGDRHGGNILVSYSEAPATTALTTATSAERPVEDSHESNTTTNDKAESQRRPHLVPIDHSYICPSAYEEPEYEWLFWPQAKVPFSERSLAYIRSLNAAADAELVRRALRAKSNTLNLVRNPAPAAVAAAEEGDEGVSGARAPFAPDEDVNVLVNAAGAALPPRQVRPFRLDEAENAEGEREEEDTDEDAAAACPFDAAVCQALRHPPPRPRPRRMVDPSHEGTPRTATAVCCADAKDMPRGSTAASDGEDEGVRSCGTEDGLTAGGGVRMFCSTGNHVSVDGAQGLEGHVPSPSKAAEAATTSQESSSDGGGLFPCTTLRTALKHNDVAEHEEEEDAADAALDDLETAAMEDVYVIASPVDLHHGSRGRGGKKAKGFATSEEDSDVGRATFSEAPSSVTDSFPSSPVNSDLAAKKRLSPSLSKRSDRRRDPSPPQRTRHESAFSLPVDGAPVAANAKKHMPSTTTHIPFPSISMTEDKSVNLVDSGGDIDAEGADGAADILFCTTRLLQMASLEFGFTAHAIGELVRRPTLTSPSFLEEAMEESRDFHTWRVDPDTFEETVRRRLAANDLVSAEAKAASEGRFMRW